MLLASAILSLGIGSALHSVLHLSVHDVRRMVRSLGPFGAPAVVFMIAAIIVFIPIPTIPIEIVAGLVYGVPLGSLLVLAGHMLGAIVAFAIARRFGRPLLRRWLGDRGVSRLDAFAAQSGFLYIFFMRLLPLFDFKLVSYAAGLTPIRTRTYVLATLAGIFPPIVILVSIGATAAARPREAALIAAAYSLVVAGTIAYFLVPKRKRVVHVHRETGPAPDIARFAGTVRIDGLGLAEGSTVAVYIGRDMCGRAVTSVAGAYVIDIDPTHHRAKPGTEVRFTVNDLPAKETSVIPPPAVTVDLDLTVAPAPPAEGGPRLGRPAEQSSL
jgi:uncharacterized membrane protein YdjX (TVP38/TMEM64 family)